MRFAAFAFASSGEPAPPIGASRPEANSNTAGTQRHDSKAFAYNRPLAPVAQWIEQPPPKGQVARSIRVRGATRRGPPDALFDLQSCVPDHFFPLGGVGQNDRDQLLGIAARRL